MRSRVVDDAHDGARGVLDGQVADPVLLHAHEGLVDERALRRCAGAARSSRGGPGSSPRRPSAMALARRSWSVTMPMMAPDSLATSAAVAWRSVMVPGDVADGGLQADHDGLLRQGGDGLMEEQERGLQAFDKGVPTRRLLACLGHVDEQPIDVERLGLLVTNECGRERQVTWTVRRLDPQHVVAHHARRSRASRGTVRTQKHRRRGRPAPAGRRPSGDHRAVRDPPG